ncbi:extracellular superoxide dismutase [Cu-Zn]-like [Antennarius striatus]|uniref:extracellular superoxide dismutase [Cu-Zn]-like n=1 Tax=Antennarius striatus TaxID=241820 RepID=UPI0035AF5FB8
MNMLGAVLIVLAGCLQCVSADSKTEAPPEVLENKGSFYAACKVRPSSTLAPGLPEVYGQVLFKQDFPDGMLEVLVSIDGFPTNCAIQLRALHIYQYGDLSQGCASTGDHYDPFDDVHPEHAGDIGNFEPRNGKISAVIQSNATMFGRWSVIGRAVVIHEEEDDMGLGGDAGSLLHGNAGARLGCCIIGISPPSHWNTERPKIVN